MRAFCFEGSKVADRIISLGHGAPKEVTIFIASMPLEITAAAFTYRSIYDICTQNQKYWNIKNISGIDTVKP